MQPPYTESALLEAVCARSDLRPTYQHPYTIQANQATYAVATDGVRALYIAAPASSYPMPPAQMHTNFRALLESAPAPTRTIWRRTIIEAIGIGPIVCPSCDGNEFQDEPEACRHCHAQGQIVCNYGHCHDCEQCGGKGYHFQRCQGPGPHFSPHHHAEYQPIVFDGVDVTIDARRLRGLIDKLPGDPFSLSNTEDTLYLHADRWTLVVKAMNATRPRHPIPTMDMPRHAEAVT